MEIGGWSLDQLMELAGLSVSQAGKHLFSRVYIQTSKKKQLTITM